MPHTGFKQFYFLKKLDILQKQIRSKKYCRDLTTLKQLMCQLVSQNTPTTGELVNIVTMKPLLQKYLKIIKVTTTVH